MALCDQGFFANRSRVVLLNGEIHIMPSDGVRHTRWAMALMQHAVRALPERYFIGVQTTLRLSRHNAPSPDLYILDGPLPDGEVAAERILLVVEVADTSLKASTLTSFSVVHAPPNSDIPHLQMREHRVNRSDLQYQVR